MKNQLKRIAAALNRMADKVAQYLIAASGDDHPPDSKYFMYPAEDLKAYGDRRAAVATVAERERLQQAFWDACKPYGKVGEVVYLTYKSKRDNS